MATLESLMEVSLRNEKLLECLVSRVDWCQEAIGRMEGWMKKKRGREGAEDVASGQLLPTEFVSVDTGDAGSESMPVGNIEEDIKVEEEDWEPEQGSWIRGEAETAKNIREIASLVSNVDSEFTSAEVHSHGIQGSDVLQEGTLKQETGMESELWSQASTSATWENTESIKVEAIPLEVDEPGKTEISDLTLGVNDSSNEHAPSSHPADDPGCGSSWKNTQRRQRKRKQLMQPTETESSNITDGFSAEYQGTAGALDTVKGQELSGKKWHQCDQCSYETQDSANFRRHKIGHRSGEEDLGCSGHEKRFASNQYMQLHYHPDPLGVAAFSCEVCGRRFSEKSSLEEHKLTHTDKKQHSCEICKKSFTHARQLKYHMDVHTAESNPCSYCGKMFRYRSQLAEHLRVHTGEKPYCCDICEKKYARRSGLNHHKKTHISEGS